MNTEYVEIKTIFQSEDEAELMASLLIAKRIVAVAHLTKMHSIFALNGNKTGYQKEIELSCVTRFDLRGLVKSFIEQNRDCENCQTTCLPIIDISKDYVKWIDRQVSHTTDRS